MSILEILEQCELFRPLVAVHISEIADQSIKKNGLDFAQMLLPYATVQINIKEPLGQRVQHNLHLDIRDIKRSGFLLSHSVFRFVLQESILTNQKLDDGNSILSRTFYNTFLHWHESAEHEHFRSYLACIFVVSAADTEPLNKLAELEGEQHREQHGEIGNSTNKRISPAYCVPPKWFFPNILKYYVLIHDNSLPNMDQQRTYEMFAAMSARYGHTLCHLIHLNSTHPTNSPDQKMLDSWDPLIERNDKGLLSGLNIAKQNLHSLCKSAKHGFESQNNLNISTIPSSLPPVSSAPSLLHDEAASQTLFTTTGFNPNCIPTNSNYFQQPPKEENDQDDANNSSHDSINSPLTYAQIASGSPTAENNDHASSTKPEDKGEQQSHQIHGQWLSDEDRQQLRHLVEDFVRGALVPFVEKQLVEQSEIVVKRGGLAKTTFSSMRKWIQSATINSTPIGAQQQQQNHLAVVNYPAESAESQSRRLADLAFLFGLYQYSNQIYQTLKKDFASDQAWLYHAGCLEMASTSAFFSSLQQNSDQIDSSRILKPSALANMRKNYPQRYMDNSIHFYADVCKQPFLALRALMNGVHILTRLELFTEAAQQLIRFTTSSELPLADLIDAVLLEHAARLFAMAKNRRKTAFYLATAGARVLKFASQQQQQISTESLQRCKRLSRILYEEVLNSRSLTGKGWAWAEHYLLCQYISCI